MQVGANHACCTDESFHSLNPSLTTSIAVSTTEATAAIESSAAPRDVLGFDSMFSGALHDIAEGVHGREKTRGQELEAPQELAR